GADGQGGARRPPLDDRPALHFAAWLSGVLAASPDPEGDGALARALGLVAEALAVPYVSIDHGDAAAEIRVSAARVELPLRAVGGPAALRDGAGTVVRASAAGDGRGRAGRGPLGALPPVGGDFLRALDGGRAEEVAAVLAGASAGVDAELPTLDGGAVELVVV